MIKFDRFENQDYIEVKEGIAVQKKQVVVRFWTVGILAVCVFFDWVTVSYWEKFLDRHAFFKAKLRNSFPQLRNKLIGSEGGSENKYITRGG